MDRLLCPDKLGVDPNSQHAPTEWNHLFMTFQNFVGKISDIGDEGKLELLMNHVSPLVYSQFSEATSYPFIAPAIIPSPAISSVTRENARIFYGMAPDYDDIANTTDVVGEWDEVIKLYAIKFPAHPPPGETIYLGMIPSPATPVGIHSFWGQEYYNYCQVSQRTETAKITDTCVPALPSGLLNKTVFWNEIRCSCFNFGLLTTHRQTMEQSRVLIEPIYFVTVKQLNVPGVLIFSLLLLTSVLAVAIAIFFDHKRGKERLLFYVDDAYPADRSYTIVVGVFTGSNPLAWTNSSVAVKVIGSNASSRVHILRSRGRRTFMSGGDDWFVIPVSQPLGKITTVSLWLDFKCISDWYCSRIMIYEVKSSKWYFVNVERWFKMYPANEETKMLSLPVTGIEQSEGNSSAFDYSFATYYFTEIRSAHLPISLFNLHRRSLSSYEEKCLVYIVKVFGVLFWTWSTLEYTLTIIFPGYSDEQLQTRVSVETQTMILLIALFSRVFTFPIEMLDRRKVVSRFIQRRTTQPLFTQKDSRSRRSESGISNPAVVFGPGVEGAQSMRSSQRADKRRSSKHSHSSADFRKKESKGTFLHDSSWRKSVYQGRSTLVPLTVGPHQFRSVNVSLNVLEQKTRRNLMISRAFVASLLTCFLVFLAYMEFFTSYWKKTRIACFFVVLTLFFDAVFLDPFLIFVKSFIAFVFFDFSNKEVNIWNDEVKQEFGARPKLGFEQYLKKATRKEYKPLIGAAFDEKKKAFFCFKAILLCFFYAVMLLALGSCIFLIKFYDTHGKWAATRSLESVFSDPISEYGNRGVRIKDVYSRPNFEEYVATNLAAADMTWSNGKFIGQNRTRWGKDHTSSPLTATNMILLLMREGTSSRQVPIELEDYLSGAVGAFSKSKQLTDSIIMGEDMIFYNVTNNGSILGRSRAEYPYAGHTYSLIAYPWDSYYTNMRFHVDLILRDPTVTPRAIIFTTNYLNRNRPVFITVDVVVELLPSGLLSAIARVSSSIAYSSRFLETTILRTSMTLVAVAMCLLNIYLLCKPTDYIGKWLTCRMWVFFLSCFASATFLGCVRHKKYIVLNTISLSYDDQFTDIQYIYTIDLWDQCLMSVVVFVISVELAVQVYRLMGSGRIAAIAASSFRIVLAVFMVAVYLIAIYEICHYHADPRLQPIVLFVFMKQLLPLISENIIYVLRDVPGLINSIVITVIMTMKFSTAVAVYYSLTLDVDRPSVIRYIFFHGLLRKKGGGTFEPRSISDGFCNYFPLMPTINKQTNDDKFQLNIDEKKQPIQLLGSNIDGKLSWLINK